MQRNRRREYYTVNNQAVYGFNVELLQHIGEHITQVILDAKNAAVVIKALDILMQRFEKINNHPGFPSAYLVQNSAGHFKFDTVVFTNAFLSDIDKMITRRENFVVLCESTVLENQSSSSTKIKM